MQSLSKEALIKAIESLRKVKENNKKGEYRMMAHKNSMLHIFYMENGRAPNSISELYCYFDNKGINE